MINYLVFREHPGGGFYLERSSFRWVVFTYLVQVFYPVPHLIDDFLFEIRAEFGLFV